MITDLDGRCVDDICVGGSVDALVETYGAQTCAPGGGRALCRWAGVLVYVPDADRDGQPDPGSSVSYLDIMRADVSNDDGLGIGASMSCFVDRLPAPDVLTLSRRDDGSWAIRELNWARAGVRVGNFMTYTFERDMGAYGDAADQIQLGSPW